DPKVIFKQINLANPNGVADFFSKHPCDYVINVAAETRLKKTLQCYEQNIYKLGMIVAKEAAAMKAKKFIQITSARIKTLKNKDLRENSITDILRNQKKLEDDLKTIPDLNYSILRPAVVYGSGDKNGLSKDDKKYILAPILILMAIYKNLKEEIALLWGEDIPISTVHVEDVVLACIHILNHEKSGEIFELADKSNSTHGSIAAITSGIFNGKYRFLGKIEHMLAKSFLEDVVEEINQKLLSAWSHACVNENVTNTPLYPHVTEEQLLFDDFEVDPKELEEIGFVHLHPKLEASELRKVVDEYASMNIFPKCYLP
ncbi:hypothetical protein HZS_2903, partial [Henneguya salminicola]